MPPFTPYPSKSANNAFASSTARHINKTPPPLSPHGSPKVCPINNAYFGSEGIVINPSLGQFPMEKFFWIFFYSGTGLGHWQFGQLVLGLWLCGPLFVGGYVLTSIESWHSGIWRGKGQNQLGWFVWVWVKSYTPIICLATKENQIKIRWTVATHLFRRYAVEHQHIRMITKKGVLRKIVCTNSFMNRCSYKWLLLLYTVLVWNIL